MASGWTNRGKYNALRALFRGQALPTNFYAALVTSAATPTADTNTKSELTEVSNGNGYTTGGISLTKNSTDFDVLTEDDTNDLALIQVKDLVWTASGGSIGAARYLVLTDDNATQGSREVWAFHDLVSDRTVSDGQALTLQNVELQLTA
jgi:hypothetical protein